MTRPYPIAAPIGRYTLPYVLKGFSLTGIAGTLGFDLKDLRLNSRLSFQKLFLGVGIVLTHYIEAFLCLQDS